jgi:hypothetical protein
MKTSLLSLIAAGALAIALPAVSAAESAHHWHRVPTVDPDKAKHDAKTPAHAAKPAHATRTGSPAKGARHAPAKPDKAGVKTKSAHGKPAPKHGKAKPDRRGRHAARAAPAKTTPAKGRRHHPAPAKGRHAHHTAAAKPRHGHKPAPKHGRHSHAAPPVHVHHWHLKKHAG